MGVKKITWKMAGFKKLRKSPGVAADIASRAERIAAMAGEGYESSQVMGKTRARASVITASYKAQLDNAKHNTLLRSLNAGG